MIPPWLSRRLAPRPALYNVPAGVPFIPVLMKSLLDAYVDAPVEIARLTLILPNRRAIHTALQFLQTQCADHEVHFAPRLRALGDIDEDDLLGFGVPLDIEARLLPAIDPLRRRLLLAQMIGDFQSRSARAIVGLSPRLRAADGLAKLLDEFALADVPIDAIDRVQSALAAMELAQHWQGALSFMQLAARDWPLRLHALGLTDAVSRRVQIMDALVAAMDNTKASGPIILAGAMGTAAVTGRLMAAIANAPNGLVIMQGVDRAMPPAEWAAIDPPHPQGLFRQRLQRHFDLASPAEIVPWGDDDAPTPRAQLLSVALMPAAATALWPLALAGWNAADPDGSALHGFRMAVAQDEEEEADFVSIQILDALSDPERSVMLVTPDRNLARRVTARLNAWGVAVDDSAGRPVLSTYRGAFLRSISAFLSRPTDPVLLLSILGHELASAGTTYADYQMAVADIRTALRRPQIPGLWPDVRTVLNQTSAIAENAVCTQLLDLLDTTIARFALAATVQEQVQVLVDLAEALAASADEDGATRLWRYTDGTALAAALDAVLNTPELQHLPAETNFEDVFAELFSSQKVRIPSQVSRLHILGQVESRLQSADVVILSSLNEGTWPQLPGEDEFLSRHMREVVGLPAAEESIGRTAHDFVQAASAPNVLLTRAASVGRTATLPSRWWRRLDQMLGASTLGQHVDQTDVLRRRARARRRVERVVPAPAPAPSPPPSIRPRLISVSSIGKLSRDPYAFYANAMLGLRPLRSVGGDIDATERGSLLHLLMETLPIGLQAVDWPTTVPQAFSAILRKKAYDPALNILWAEQIQILAALAADISADLADSGATGHVEMKATWRKSVGDETFAIIGRADRIDFLPRENALSIVDFKSRSAPTMKQDAAFEPQVSILGLMAMAGAFGDLKTNKIHRVGYVSLRSKSTEAKPDGGVLSASKHMLVGEEVLEHLAETEKQLDILLTDYMTIDKTFRSQIRRVRETTQGDYDHLARRAEWQAEDSDDD